LGSGGAPERGPEGGRLSAGGGGRQVELLLTLEEFCSEEGTFEGLQEGGRHFTAIFPKARPARAHAAPQPLQASPNLCRAVVCLMLTACQCRRCLFLAVPWTQAAVRSGFPDSGRAPGQVLELLYDLEVVAEGAFMAWAGEKAHASKEERAYLERAQAFLQWLREASEEEDSGSDSGEE